MTFFIGPVARLKSIKLREAVSPFLVRVSAGTLRSGQAERALTFSPALSPGQHAIYRGGRGFFFWKLI